MVETLKPGTTTGWPKLPRGWRNVEKRPTLAFLLLESRLTPILSSLFSTYVLALDYLLHVNVNNNKRVGLSSLGRGLLAMHSTT